MKNIYRLKSTIIIDTNDGEKTESKRETYHTNLDELKAKLKAKLPGVKFNEYSHTIYVDGKNVKKYVLFDGTITRRYHWIDIVKADENL